MSGYQIYLSNGDTLTNINVKTVDDRSHTSLVLIGQGVPNYGDDIAQDLVWLLENFAKNIPPVRPLIGQEWYDTSSGQLKVYTGAEWQPLLTSETSFTGLFEMLPSATNIDFTLETSVQIFTGPDVSRYYCPTYLILVPNGEYSATDSPTFNLSVSNSGDILSNTTLSVSSPTAFAKIELNAQPELVTAGATVSLNVTTAAQGGQINYDAYLFGFTI